jgi:hypothetical protein
MHSGILRSFLSCALVAILPCSLLGQELPAQAGGAILHSDGGVWVNGYEAHDSSAVFPGDVIETKPGASANLVLDGSTVLLAPESVGKFQNDVFELDHGVVSVVTAKSYKVRVNCIRVIPVQDQWTQYVVSDLNRSVQVSAKKLDVNVEHERGRGKPTPETEATQRASVHEGEQKNYEENEICGAPAPPNGPLNGISPKWIAGGAAGAGLLLCVLLHCFGGSGGGTQSQVSPSSP